jgi:hypothetical protein
MKIVFTQNNSTTLIKKITKKNKLKKNFQDKIKFNIIGKSFRYMVLKNQNRMNLKFMLILF